MSTPDLATTHNVLPVAALARLPAGIDNLLAALAWVVSQPAAVPGEDLTAAFNDVVACVTDAVADFELQLGGILQAAHTCAGCGAHSPLALTGPGAAAAASNGGWSEAGQMRRFRCPACARDDIPPPPPASTQDQGPSRAPSPNTAPAIQSQASGNVVQFPRAAPADSQASPRDALLAAAAHLLQACDADCLDESHVDALRAAVAQFQATH